MHAIWRKSSVIFRPSVGSSLRVRSDRQEREVPTDRPRAVFPCACYLLLAVFGIWCFVLVHSYLVFCVWYLNTWYLVLWQKWEVPSDRPGAVFPCGEPVEPEPRSGAGGKSGQGPARPPTCPPPHSLVPSSCKQLRLPGLPVDARRAVQPRADLVQAATPVLSLPGVEIPGYSRGAGPAGPRTPARWRGSG